jgi:hypothetical protein
MPSLVSSFVAGPGFAHKRLAARAVRLAGKVIEAGD